ncbi:MAG: histidine phosphatase family protein [Bacilli bacterium]|nr:histidine phosphatase family protein [Bacilli bacterium]
MTTIYLMRHSRGNLDRNYINVNESFQIENEKYILSVDGEKRALKYSQLDELKDIDMVVSSNYVRAMSTAKYIAYANNIPLYIDEDFNERKFGVDDVKKLPQDFFIKQMNDEDYKLENGESRKEVYDRMIKGLIKVMKKNKDKKAVIVSHASSIAFLLMRWCRVELVKGKYLISFKGEEVLNGFNSPELLKLEFNEKNKLMSIQTININE